MSSSGSLKRGSVIHDEDLTIILKQTNVMISSIGPNHKNGDFGFIEGVDTIEGFLGK